MENPIASRFCGGCGQPLHDRVARERRQLTVMFCDLVGSTVLAERLDPEDLADLILAYQRAVSDAIGEFAGHVAQHLGDGMLVYFGYPVAHEDDPRRAVFAGLRILDSIALLNARLDPALRLAVRIGIHTGPVVTGELGSGTTQERLALGSTPNVAAKLQSIADPNTVLVTQDTRNLLGQTCVLESLSSHRLESLSVPIIAHRVIARSTGLVFGPSTEMVGRREEFERLCHAFETASSGRCTAVTVTAEAGLGKSRLVHALREQLDGLAGACWVVQCSPYEQESALSAVTSLLNRMLDVGDTQSPSERLARLVSAIEALGIATFETVPLLAGLLSIPLEAPFAQLDVSPQKRKELIFEAVASILVRRTQKQVTIWLVEDLHWADPSSVDFLGFLLARAPSARLLLLMTARPSFVSSWGDRAISVVLKPLDRADATAVITRVAGGKALPAHFVDQILDRTDGVPLFVEELTKTILESGALLVTADGYRETELAYSVSIPSSLQASLAARLDRLGSAKEIAQLASVIGREFSTDVLRAVAPWGDDVLLDGLRRLMDADLVYQDDGAPLQTRYWFKHALVRDAAYEMLLKSARRDYHHKIASALVERFPGIVDARPELVAHHFSQSSTPHAAIPYWIKAGEKGARESANVEAVAHLQRALALLDTQPPSPERDALELNVHLTLGPSLVLAKGYVVDEVERTYLRAQELNERGGDIRNRFWIGFAICQFTVLRGEIADGKEIAKRTLALAESLEDPFFLARAHCLLGGIECYAGDFATSAAWLQSALAHLPGPDAEFLVVAGMDLGAFINMYAAWSAWHLGFPDKARDHIQSALVSAAATGRAHALGHALVLGATAVSHFLEDVEAVRRYSREAIDVSNKHGIPTWAMQAGLWSAWADAATGGPDVQAVASATSLALLDSYRATGAMLSLSYFTAVAAETQLFCGAFECAESLIDVALALVAEGRDPMWEAEINRLKGELILRRTDGPSGAETRADAEQFFVRALGIARQQGSHALEDRAVASLTRLAAMSGNSTPEHH